MKYICKDNFEINDILVGTKGDLLEVTDAVIPNGTDAEDYDGYCDIKNLNTNQVFEATWMDIDDTLEPVG